ncbi:MAG: Chaperone protein DnaJ [Microgenomates group bacterium GW2011_GWC1_47_20]|uniref:Chaperone protein DnaJ n=1 Tax=Candidatus Amesbacteria bacterium GW2011_GWC2_45_19 TaxID=1618366 RepID=A0A0G1M4Q4_9BACT|nr:MAG: Chaperone protein DnaJ [Candidatus Amesbacteria bacterium GW2011_GWC2_45_19]KKU69242.1 MAG: Chaperone protein DnaJ [Microgenomates group bacterium GW2011_GWC1_47_20]
MAAKRDYYDILGVSKGASDAQIKSAYRKMAMQWHPDKNKSPEAEEKFKEINEAYQVLSDSQKKQTYDQFGHTPPGGFSGGSGFAGQQQGPFQYYYSTSGGGQNPFGDMGDPFEIFEQFFGGASPFGRSRPAKPHYSLRIPFKTAVSGGTESVTIDGRTHAIKIPAGADTGTHLRFTDFDITFEVEPDLIFRRDGADIYIDHKIPFTLAILGGTTSVPTLDADLKLKIRPGTQPGTMVRLAGRGVANRGDFYIRLIIDFPTHLSHRQKQILEEFERS